MLSLTLGSFESVGGGGESLNLLFPPGGLQGKGDRRDGVLAQTASWHGAVQPLAGLSLATWWSTGASVPCGRVFGALKSSSQVARPQSSPALRLPGAGASGIG